MCLRSPDLPTGDPNRSLTGTKIDNFLLLAGEPAGNVEVGFSHGPTSGKLTSFGSVKTGKTGSFLITSRWTRPTFSRASAAGRAPGTALGRTW